MGNRDKGGKEVKKPKKTPAKDVRPLSDEPVYSTPEVVPRKRKVREDDE